MDNMFLVKYNKKQTCDGTYENVLKFNERGDKMKQFIYLDTDMVNSIIAQKDKGLVLEVASEHEDTSGREHEKSVNLTVNGSASGGIWKFAQAQAELSGTGEVVFNKHSQTVLKEIATKTLHDAAFDIAYEQLHSEYDFSPKSADLGSFVELNQAFVFVDLVYLEGLLAKGSLIDFLKKSEREQLELQLNKNISYGLNHEQQRKNAEETKKRIEDLLAANDKEYDDIVEMVKVIRQMIPYDRLLVAHDGYLIPLEDKYFRDNPQTMAFKHGGYITCFGYITNVIGETSETATENVFLQLQTLVNQTLISMLPTREKDLFVVHPIALYYGQ